MKSKLYSRTGMIACLMTILISTSNDAYSYQTSASITMALRVRQDAGYTWFNDGITGTPDNWRATRKDRVTARNHVTDEFRVPADVTCSSGLCDVKLTIPDGIGYVESVNAFRNNKIGLKLYPISVTWDLPGAVFKYCKMSFQTAGSGFRQPWPINTWYEPGNMYWTSASYNGTTNIQLKHIKCTNLPADMLERGLNAGVYHFSVTDRWADNTKNFHIWAEGYWHMDSLQNQIQIKTSGDQNLTCTTGARCTTKITWWAVDLYGRTPRLNYKIENKTGTAGIYLKDGNPLTTYDAGEAKELELIFKSSTATDATYTINITGTSI